MRSLIILCCLCFSYFSFAQNTSNAEISKATYAINTVNENYISIKFEIDLSDPMYLDYNIDDESFHDLNPDLNPKLYTKNYPKVLNNNEQVDVDVNRKQIVFSIKNLSTEFINMLRDSVLKVYIKTENDIVFNVIKNDNEATLKALMITKLQIEENSRSISVLTDQMAKELIDAKGGEIHLTQNKFDFGVIPADQSSSSKTEYNLSFNYTTRYSFLNEKLPVFFKTEGLVGTNTSDSLNYVSIYPINYIFMKGSNELIGEFGVESNQLFTNYRISGNFVWNAIIPNIIDLTFGEDRLRLKPVIKVGVKFYQEIENSRPVHLNSNVFSNQVFSEFYYYIPIQKIYSLIIEGTVFYDFNPNVNPNQNAMFNYTATLGIDIPKTDFKTIFKYTKGENGISYQTTDYFMIGLMIDSFGVKKQ